MVENVTAAQAKGTPTLKAAFAMGAEHLPTLFSAADLAKLGEMLQIVNPQPVTDFSHLTREQLQSVQVLITGWDAPLLDRAALDQMPALQAVIHGAGTVKTFVTDAVFERGIQVTSAAEANAKPVAEFTYAAIIMGLKRTSRFVEQYRSTNRKRGLDKLPPVGSNNVTIGLVGASRVGRSVMTLLRSMDARVLVSDPFLSEAEASLLGVELVDLDMLCASSNVVSLHAPAIPATKHMIGKAQLASMANGTVIVNTARGSLIDADALEAELVSGRLDAYLDVTTPEPLPSDSVLFRLPNVVITPHIAGALGNEVHRLGSYALTEVEHLVEGLPLRYPVLAEDLARIA